MPFINIHSLRTLPFSNVNRDAYGSPKSVTFGGVPRARISSQAIKRAARVGFESTSPADRTDRTKFAPARVVEMVQEKLGPLSPEDLDTASKQASEKIESLVTKAKSGTEKAGSAKKAASSSPDATSTLVFLAEAELGQIAGQVIAALNGILRFIS